MWLSVFVFDRVIEYFIADAQDSLPHHYQQYTLVIIHGTPRKQYPTTTKKIVVGGNAQTRSRYRKLYLSNYWHDNK